MITLQQALGFMGTDNPQEIRDIALRRLEGEDVRSVGSPWLDEDPVDVLVPILTEDVHAETREAVIQAWRNLYPSILRWVASQEVASNTSGTENREVLSRLCRLVEIARPDSLRGCIETLLSAALANPHIDPEVTYEILSSWRAYPRTEADLPLVLRLIEQEHSAAAAFDMLMEIDPTHIRVEEYLYQLWSKKHRQGWDVDPVFQAIGLEERLGEPTPIVRVLRRLREERAFPWSSIKQELHESARTGGKHIHDWVREAESYKPKRQEPSIPVSHSEES